MFTFRCCPVHFDEPREVYAVGKRVADRADVGRETVSGDLEILARSSVAQAFDENIRGGLIALAESEGEEPVSCRVRWLRNNKHRPGSDHRRMCAFFPSCR